MQYALMLKSHANVRYAQSLRKLASLECECLLDSLNVQAEVSIQPIADVPFLVVSCDPLNEQQWQTLSRHSAVAFAASLENGLLRPLAMRRPSYVEDDLAQVLKYKGKTNADFTSMMLHCARSASAFAATDEPLTVLDPICGHGTTLFCALQEGENAVGIDADEKALHEADVYFERYLQFHRLKHRREETSLTLPKNGHARERRFTFADTPEHYKRQDVRTLRLIAADTSQTDRLAVAQQCHLIVGDLPYGVQHAPKEGGELSSLQRLLAESLPAYYRALRRGGAIALAFNTYTLSAQTVREEMRRAGFHTMDEPPYNDFAHWVEQAVNRDFVVAVRE